MMQNKDTHLTYSESIAELEKILATMQSGECDIDNLSTLTRRATTLLKECRERLTATEAELTKALDELKATTGTAN